MIFTKAVGDITEIQAMKDAYIRGLEAPLDGMWDTIANSSPHRVILVDGEPAGYFVTDGSEMLLQFYLDADHLSKIEDSFHHLLTEGFVSSALVSTADPLLYRLSEQTGLSMIDHTVLYEADSDLDRMPAVVDDDLRFQRVDATDLERVVRFQQSCLDTEADLSDWLRGYSGNLIARGELYCLFRSDKWIGLGELRRSDSQSGIADLGVMVSPTHRRKGWGTDILVRLMEMCDRDGLRAICSTTVDNIGSQKAIERAGFVSRHRMVEVSF